MVIDLYLKVDIFLKVNVFTSMLQVKLGQPGPDELGFADSVSVEEIGGVRVSPCSLSWIENLL